MSEQIINLHSPLIRRRTSCENPASGLSGLPAILRRLYHARGIQRADQIGQGLQGLHRPAGLGGVDRAVELLANALEQRQHILVVGDYDADGATACALSVSLLQAFGAQQVDYLVPDRFTQGYGLSDELAQQAADFGADLLMTVDNGISSLTGVRVARRQGLKVVITDHHLPGDQLPDADAIVNPNLPDDAFPSKHLAGVGVAFYLMSALRTRLRDSGWFQQRGLAEPVMAEWLDLVALGTVADLVRLDGNNRILVEQGLRRIRSGQCRPGISALLQVAGRSRQRIVASDLGFSVGPRLNAAGRLQDMRVGIRCLLCKDENEAVKLAIELDSLNKERRQIEAEMRDQAEAMMQSLVLDGIDLPFGVCLFDPEWHEGVIGILAARVREGYHRPVICMAGSGDAQLKGSARSIAGLHIRDVLAVVDSRHPGLILKFGGHAMAAGLSIDQGRLEEFRQAFDQAVAEALEHEAPRQEWLTDGPLSADEMTLETARLLRYAGPWGQGFSEPVFDGEFEILSSRLVGGVHLKMLLQQSGITYDAIHFRWNRPDTPTGCAQLVYRLDVNEYRGVESLQLLVDYIGLG